MNTTYTDQNGHTVIVVPPVHEHEVVDWFGQELIKKTIHEFNDAFSKTDYYELLSMFPHNEDARWLIAERHYGDELQANIDEYGSDELFLVLELRTAIECMEIEYGDYTPAPVSFASDENYIEDKYGRFLRPSTLDLEHYYSLESTMPSTNIYKILDRLK